MYAPNDKVEARNYGVARYGMEVQRILDVLDRHLSGRTYVVGDDYTIADICLMTWVNQVRTGYPHPSGVSANGFLSFDRYANVNAWLNLLLERPAVQRGLTVCSFKTPTTPKPWLAAPATEPPSAQ